MGRNGGQNVYNEKEEDDTLDHHISMKSKTMNFMQTSFAELIHLKRVLMTTIIR